MKNQPAPSEAHSATALDADAIQKAIRRMAHEIVEQHTDPERLVLAGIPTRGLEVARRLADHIQKIDGARPYLGAVDISMHRDDISTRGKVTALQVTDLPIDLNKRPLILVDDVFFTGRTTRAALDAVASFGRPAKIQLAVLVDRGHRELPIRPDFVGKNLPTAREEKIRVRFETIDGAPDSVLVVKS
jgi:pyrimidine operon attenuation protein/uracil phosphoribosyltransferase